MYLIFNVFEWELFYLKSYLFLSNLLEEQLFLPYPKSISLSNYTNQVATAPFHMLGS